jgi:hypothetical protein
MRQRGVVAPFTHFVADAVLAERLPEVGHEIGFQADSGHGPDRSQQLWRGGKPQRLAALRLGVLDPLALQVLRAEAVRVAAALPCPENDFGVQPGLGPERVVATVLGDFVFRPRVEAALDLLYPVGQLRGFAEMSFSFIA